MEERDQSVVRALFVKVRASLGSGSAGSRPVHKEPSRLESKRHSGVKNGFTTIKGDIHYQKVSSF